MSSLRSVQRDSVKCFQCRKDKQKCKRQTPSQNCDRCEALLHECSEAQTLKEFRVMNAQRIGINYSQKDTLTDAVAEPSSSTTISLSAGVILPNIEPEHTHSIQGASNGVNIDNHISRVQSEAAGATNPHTTDIDTIHSPPISPLPNDNNSLCSSIAPNRTYTVTVAEISDDSHAARQSHEVIDGRNAQGQVYADSDSDDMIHMLMEHRWNSDGHNGGAAGPVGVEYDYSSGRSQRNIGLFNIHATSMAGLQESHEEYSTKTAQRSYNRETDTNPNIMASPPYHTFMTPLLSSQIRASIERADWENFRHLLLAQTTDLCAHDFHMLLDMMCKKVYVPGPPHTYRSSVHQQCIHCLNLQQFAFLAVVSGQHCLNWRAPERSIRFLLPFESINKLQITIFHVLVERSLAHVHSSGSDNNTNLSFTLGDAISCFLDLSKTQPGDEFQRLFERTLMAVDTRGRSWLHRSWNKGSHTILQRLFCQFPDQITAMVNIQDANGDTPLHYSIDDLKLFEYFVTCSRTVCVTNYDTWSPLHILVQNLTSTGLFDLPNPSLLERCEQTNSRIKVLLRAGAVVDINKANTSDFYAIDHKIGILYTNLLPKSTMEVLLDSHWSHHVNVNMQDAYGRTPLLWAIHQQNFLYPYIDSLLWWDSACMLIIKGGANVNTRDIKGKTPLLLLVENLIRTVELHETGLNGISDKLVALVLHVRLARALAHLLMRNNSDPTAQDDRGRCAYELVSASWKSWDRSLLFDPNATFTWDFNTSTIFQLNFKNTVQSRTTYTHWLRLILEDVQSSVIEWMGTSRSSYVLANAICGFIRKELKLLHDIITKNRKRPWESDSENEDDR